MKIKTITDEKSGQRWDIFKKSENQYYSEYYEYFQVCGWKLINRDGDEKTGYFTKEAIELQLDINL